jgi:hypothetical protein
LLRVVPVLRWLLSFVAALALVGQAAAAYAGAGIVGDTSCCCPVPTECKCHDHDGKPKPAPILKRCGGDEVKLVAPVVLLAIAPPAPVVCVTRRAVAVEHVASPLPDEPSIAIEKPPF